MSAARAPFRWPRRVAAPSDSLEGCAPPDVAKFIGKPLNPALAQISLRTGGKVTRVYQTGAALTMDFRSDRLNVEIDKKKTIVRLRCG